MNSIPKLDASAWEINGAALTAWINDLEFYEIAVVADAHRLTLNNAATAEVERLGYFIRLTEAQKAAQDHVGDSE